MDNLPLPPINDFDITLPIYSTITDLANITNILFIDNSIPDSNLFLNSLSNNTFAILYNYNTNSSHILQFLTDTFTSIQRIAFVFHGFSLDSSYFLKPFLNFGNFFEISDLTSPPPQNFSQNVTFILNLLNLFNVKHLDFLGCNLASIPLWKSYFDFISSQLPLLSIGASTDDTGNLTNTSNWLMETTHEDIKNIYFNSNIHSFSQVLIQYNIGLFSYDYSASVLFLYRLIDTTLIGDVVCPDTVTINNQTVTVTGISDYAFQGCTGLTSVTIPPTVTIISSNAFKNCTGIKSFTLQPGLVTIGDSAFRNCYALESMAIPETVMTIGYSVFSRCYALTSLTIPDSVTSVGDLTLGDCTKLISFTVPLAVTSIGFGAFGNCPGLTSINIRNNVTSISDYAFQGCTGLTSVTIPSSVTSISSNAFKNCINLTSITLQSGLVSIGDSVFRGCSKLNSINIPPTVTSIGTYVFNRCYELTTVNLSNGLTSIPAATFSDCHALSSITIPSSVTSIGVGAFTLCTTLNSITIPPNVTSIGDTSFAACTNLASITILSSDTTIGINAFQGAGLTNIYYSGPITSAFLTTPNTGASAPSNIIISLPRIYLISGWNTIGMSYNFTITDPSGIIIPNTKYSFYNDKFTDPKENNIFNSNTSYYIKTTKAGYINYNITSSLFNTINATKGLNMICLQTDSVISNLNNIISIDPPILNNTLLKEINYWIKFSVNGQIGIAF